ncbi:MAG TPA: ribosome assembly RNA-binding protein YhbY [Burkholderiaceae bacterium]|nr:ribosome assembly RNA-binding protein YhbY [Burkholderiaceae bacterium]
MKLAHEHRLRLRAQAHRLHPMVQLGVAGLSEAVFQEIDRALRAHGLIKVRAAGAQRATREDLARAMAERLGAARVQVIGNTVILFRPVPEPVAGAPSGSPAPQGGPASRVSGADGTRSAVHRAPTALRRSPNRGLPQR